DRLPQLAHASLRLPVGRTEAEDAALLAVKTRSFQERLVHASLRRVPGEAEGLFLRVIDHPLDEVPPGGGRRRGQESAVDQLVTPVRSRVVGVVARLREEIIDSALRGEGKGGPPVEPRASLIRRGEDPLQMREDILLGNRDAGSNLPPGRAVRLQL